MAEVYSSEGAGRNNARRLHDFSLRFQAEWPNREDTAAVEAVPGYAALRLLMTVVW